MVITKPAEPRVPRNKLPLMSKHMHIIHRWVSEKVDDNEIKFTHVASSENVVDLATTAPFKPAFETPTEKLGLRNVELEQQIGRQQKATE